MDPFWTALALTTFAGLATVLGGVLAAETDRLFAERERG